MIGRVFELITENRTIAEILLHAHASEYVVYRLLFELFRAGAIKIGAVCRLHEELNFAIGGVAVRAPVQESRPARLRSDAPPLPLPIRRARGSPAAVAARATETERRRFPRGPRVTTRTSSTRRGNARARRVRALDRSARRAGHKRQPGEDALRRLLAEAEAAFRRQGLPSTTSGDQGPVPGTVHGELAAEPITPAEFFLLSGSTDRGRPVDRAGQPAAGGGRFRALSACGRRA